VLLSRQLEPREIRLVPDFFSGLLAFAVYFAGATGFCALFCLIYTRMTRHDEFALIIEAQNASAAIAFGGSLLGFAISLAAAIHHTGSIAEFAMWGAVALVTQIIAYGLARLAHPGLSQAIQENALSAAIWVAAVSISAGLLSAACMSP
jgi:putative membrane protein